MRKVPHRLGLSFAILTLISAFSAFVPAKAQGFESREGFSGLPVPRFVALRKNEVYGRAGPGTQNDVVVIYRKKGLPVKVIAETSDNVWRRVEDHHGRRVWINRVMLSENRHTVIATPAVLFAEPTEEALPRARLEPGVMARLETCDGSWCRVRTDRYRGWTERTRLWGTPL